MDITQVNLEHAYTCSHSDSPLHPVVQKINTSQHKNSIDPEIWYILQLSGDINKIRKPTPVESYNMDTSNTVITDHSAKESPIEADWCLMD